jgi:hypothetical protein
MIVTITSDFPEMVTWDLVRFLSAVTTGLTNTPSYNLKWSYISDKAISVSSWCLRLVSQMFSIWWSFQFPGLSHSFFPCLSSWQVDKQGLHNKEEVKLIHQQPTNKPESWTPEPLLAWMPLCILSMAQHKFFSVNCLTHAELCQLVFMVLTLPKACEHAWGYSTVGDVMCMQSGRNSF